MRKVLLIGVALSAVTTTSSAQGKNPPPTMPRLLEGYCEGESCGFDYKVVACKDLTPRSDGIGSARRVGTIAKGDTAEVVTGNVRVTAPGIVVLLRDTVLASDDDIPRTDVLHLSRGDTVYVLEYREVGWWAMWYRGQLSERIEFWNGPAQVYFGKGRDSLAGYSARGPTRETWLKLRRGSVEGWWLREEGVWSRPDWGINCER